MDVGEGLDRAVVRGLLGVELAALHALLRHEALVEVLLLDAERDAAQPDQGTDGVGEAAGAPVAVRVASL